MSYLLIIIAAIIIASTNAYARISDSVLKAILMMAIPLLIGNAIIFSIFRSTSHFVITYFTFISVYATVGILIGSLVFNEALTLYTIVGICLIIIGCMIMKL